MSKIKEVNRQIHSGLHAVVAVEPWVCLGGHTVLTHVTETVVDHGRQGTTQCEIKGLFCSRMNSSQ